MMILNIYIFLSLIIMIIIINSSLLSSRALTVHFIKKDYLKCFVQNFIRINSYVLNIFCRMNSKKDIWRKLFSSTLFKKFRYIPERFLSARKLSVIKDHLKKRIKLFPVWPDLFLFSNPILTGLLKQFGDPFDIKLTYDNY